MALFIIERNFAERLQEMTKEGVAQTLEVNEELGVDWLLSFMSADRKKTYCLYEAPDADRLREHARTLGIPVDEVVEVTQLSPKAFA